MSVEDLHTFNPEIGIHRDEAGKPLISLAPEEVYRFGHLIRSIETLLLRLFAEGQLSGTTHTCIGQELCQMAVVRALHHEGDAVLSNHRNHGHFLTYSGNCFGLIAEIMGRKGGVASGIGGSQHIAYRHFHSNGVQAGMTAIGVGLALARKMRGDGSVVACIVGDGTFGEGLLYESMNLAAIWQLPLLFVVEHNAIAQTTPTNETTGGSIAARGAAFGLNVKSADDSDDAFLENVERFVGEVRSQGTPGMLVIRTARLGPHSKGDDMRDAGEMEAIRQRDPLQRIGERLPQPLRKSIEESSDAIVRQIYDTAMAAAPASDLVAETHAYRPARTFTSAGTQSGGNVRNQINAALRELLEADLRVVLLGEDLHDPYGGAFKVTKGLSTDYPGRVISTPISEAGIVGTGIGLAMAGFRPIVEIMFADFVTLAMDQIYNHAVKFPAMFAHCEIPIVIRTPSGGRRGYGPTHSQNPENLMAAVPGLTVLFPSPRHAVGEALRNAVLGWPNPTVFFEHKLLYSESGDTSLFHYRPLPAGDDLGTELFPTLVAGGADPDLSIVCYGGMVPEVEKLVTELAGEEMSVEIVIPELLSPLPKHQLCRHLKDRALVLTVEEGYGETGFGSSLGCALLENGFAGRFRRVCTAPVPIPAARSLESKIIVGRDHMFTAILELITRS